MRSASSSATCQARLLRATESGEIKAVGSPKTRLVDVRLLSATNRNLRAEVQAGRFREDLYYRLNVGRIELPPLRQCRDDIPLLGTRGISGDCGGVPARRLAPTRSSHPPSFRTHLEFTPTWSSHPPGFRRSGVHRTGIPQCPPGTPNTDFRVPRPRLSNGLISVEPIGIEPTTSRVRF
ncbi:MAG: sigma 54-interacting transcriptional regulator [Deltaproteobacteria bacterium]